MKTGHVMLMADVVVDTKLTCMYVSIDAIVDIRLAKLVIYFVFFTWTLMCTRNLKTVIHIDVDQGRRGHSQCLHTCTYP